MILKAFLPLVQLCKINKTRKELCRDIKPSFLKTPIYHKCGIILECVFILRISFWQLLPAWKKLFIWILLIGLCLLISDWSFIVQDNMQVPITFLLFLFKSNQILVQAICIWAWVWINLRILKEPRLRLKEHLKSRMSKSFCHHFRDYLVYYNYCYILLQNDPEHLF